MTINNPLDSDLSWLSRQDSHNLSMASNIYKSLSKGTSASRCLTVWRSSTQGGHKRMPLVQFPTFHRCFPLPSFQPATCVKLDSSRLDPPASTFHHIPPHQNRWSELLSYYSIPFLAFPSYLLLKTCIAFISLIRSHGLLEGAFWSLSCHKSKWKQ